jgi:hypothetical protein
MKQEIRDYLHDRFDEIFKQKGFEIANESDGDDGYLIEYRSEIFTFRIEKFRREFHVSLFRTNISKDAANLFNVLGFLHQNSANPPTSNFFIEETDIEKNYKKQIDYIRDAIYNNLAELNDFFGNGDVKSKLSDLEKYMQNRYPWLFKRS